MEIICILLAMVFGSQVIDVLAAFGIAMCNNMLCSWLICICLFVCKLLCYFINCFNLLMMECLTLVIYY